VLKEAEEELEKAKVLLQKAKKLLDECNNSERPTPFLRSIMKDAERSLLRAEILLKNDPSRSTAFSKHVQALAKILVSDLTRRLEARSEIEECKRVEESLKTLKIKVENLLEKFEVLPKRGNTSKIKRILIGALEEINEGLKLVSSRRSLTEAIKKLSAAQLVVKRCEIMIRKALKDSKEGKSRSSDSFRCFTSSLKIGQRESFKVNESKSNMSQTLVIEAENKSMIRESIIDFGEAAIISLSREPTYENEPAQSEIVMEVNQSLIGAIINVTTENVTLVKTCEDLKIKLMKLDRVRIRFSVEAPEKTCRKIFLIKLDSEIFSIDKLEDVKVYVNGSEAVLALSLLDLASGVYDEPAYIFIISSKGVSVLIYIPHFSSYTIDVVAVFKQASSLRTVLMKILTRETFAITTIVATIIFMISMLLHARRIASRSLQIES